VSGGTESEFYPTALVLKMANRPHMNLAILDELERSAPRGIDELVTRITA